MKFSHKIILIITVITILLFTGCNKEEDINEIDTEESGVEEEDLREIDTEVQDVKVTDDKKHVIRERKNDEELYIEVTQNTEPIMDAYQLPYPRLAMWWLEAYEESAESIGRYDLLLNELDSPVLVEKVQEIREINEDIILLRPLSPSERTLFEYESDIPNPAIAYLPTSFFMMHKGTVLTRDLSSEDNKVLVQEVFDEVGNPIFYVGDDISIGRYESAKVLAIDEERKELKVSRGYIRKVQTHTRGEAVQAHVRFWPGSWVMNITAACPKETVFGVEEPVNYITYFHLLCQNKVSGLFETLEDNPLYVNDREVNYDGFIIDRFEDHQSWLQWLDEERRPLDVFLDGRILEDDDFDKLVQETVEEYSQLLRNTYGDKYIIRNNAMTLNHESHHGQVYESFGWDEPNREWWNGLFVNGVEEPLYSGYEMLSYLEWFEARKDALIYMEVYEDEGGADSDGDGSYENPFDRKDFKANEKKAQFSITSTLLGNGFYSYEINTNGHGILGLFWFDFYDNGGEGKGYLGYPVADAREIIDGVYIREYEYGAVIVNVSDKVVFPEFSKAVEVASGFEYDVSVGIDSFEGCIFIYDN